jgi:CRISPR-associated endonuclease Csn1
LDIGTNSLGWSVLGLNEAGEPCAIRDAGIRIFNDGRDDTSKATLKADRRAARSARRRHDRYKQRRAFLLDELTKAGLFPEDPEERHKLQTRDPLRFRAKALTEKLEPHEIGRALFHLNQRRGFKSNRKDRSKETTSGMIDNSVIALLRAMGLMETGSGTETFNGLTREQKQRQKKEALEQLRQQQALTFGLFLWQQRERGEPTRARPSSDGKLYDVYPTRDMLEHEFDVIWRAQAEYHPELLTEQKRERVRTVIFTQRKLKPQKVGKCTYLPDEDRTFQAMPSFQRYRIYQEVNHLEWTTGQGRYRLIDHPEARDKIVALLERPTTKKGNVTFGKMKKVLQHMGLANGDVQFNCETPKRIDFDGNHTSNLMQDERCVGPEWHNWPLEKQDQFISVILNDEDDQKVHDILMRDYGLSDAAATASTEAPLKGGTASLSNKAAYLLLAKMCDDKLIQSDAVQAVVNEEADFVNPFKRAGAGALLDRLPYYGEAVQGHIIPGKGDEEDEQTRIGMVTNPTVHIALNQIRHVVNELLDRYGHPASIAIELGRELPAGQKGRAEINKEQKANQDNNARLGEILCNNHQDVTPDNRLRLHLWEELDKDPNGRCCPFSGQKIGIADLFNGNAEIEHLIPFSISLDNSRANKVICTRQANREKGNNTPFEAFGHSPDGYVWDDIVERAKRLPKQKQWRFQKDAREIWKRDCSDFTERHLNDTRYIGRLAKEYLENICPFNKIDVLTGRLTALLRGH